MIKKIYRLKENDVKKVLKYRKPFFSYQIVANQANNNLWFDRYAIVIGGKSVENNVSRNFFRRKFYDIIDDFSKNNSKQMGIDIVFVVKKQIKLDKKSFESITAFAKDVGFLLKKLYHN